MQEELHLFIIWSKGLYLQEPIIDDIKKHFEIKQIFNCNWEKQSFASHLSRFYGKKLFQCYKKEKRCGNDNFLAIVVIDKHPHYKDGLNLNTADLKYKYRSWYGGGFLIHASDTAEEGAENLKTLTGLSVPEFLARYPKDWDGNHISQLEEKPLALAPKENFYLKLLHSFSIFF